MAVVGDLAVLALRVDASQGIREVEVFGGKLNTLGAQGEAVISKLKSLFAGVSAALVARQVIDYADAWRLVQSRIGLATSSQEELVSVQGRLFAIAQSTRSVYEDTANTYAKIARNAAELHASQSDVLTVTQAINQAFRVSGAGAQEASAAILQLGQAFASGTLRGDELRSVLEQAPRLAQAIAAGMGTTVGQLRKLGEEGKLESRAVFDAIKSQAAAIGAEFEKVPVTVGQALTVARNELQRWIGGVDSATGATATLAEGIVGLSRNLDTIATLATAVGAAFVGRYVSGLALSKAATVDLYAQVLAGNAVLLDGVTAQRARATAAVDAARVQQAASAQTVAALRAEQAQLEANVVAARAQFVAASQRLAQVPGGPAALAPLGGAVVEREVRAQVQARAALGAAQATLNAATARGVVIEGEMTAALAAHTTANNAALAASVRRLAVINSTSIATRAAAVATGALSTALTFLGGPIGATILAAVVLYTQIDKIAEAYARWKTGADRIGQTDAESAATDRAIEAFKARRQAAEAEAAYSKEAQKTIATQEGLLAKQLALNAAHAQGELVLKLLTIAYDAQAKKAENAVQYHGKELVALNSLVDANARAAATAATLAEADRAEREARSQVRDFDASEKAARNEIALAEAAGRVAKARLVSEDAANREAVALEHLRIQQTAEASAIAALNTLREEQRGATPAQAQAAKETYDRTIANIGATKFYRDALVDLNYQLNRQAEAGALSKTIADNVRSLNIETRELERETAARKQGQRAVDALNIAIVGERAVREEQQRSIEKGIALTDEEARAIRGAAEQHERAAQAVAKQSLDGADALVKEFARGVYDDLSKGIADGLAHGFSGIGGLLDAVYAQFLQFAARVAALKIGEKIFEKIKESSAANAPQTGAGGIPLAVGSGVQPLGNSFADIAGPFAIATTAVFAFTSALNRLIGAVDHSAEAIVKKMNDVVGALASFDQFTRSQRLELSGSPLEKAIGGVQSQFTTQREQIQTGLAGKQFEDLRNQKLAELNKLEADRVAQLLQEAGILARLATEDAAIRTLRANGAVAEADAAAFAAQQARELAEAIKQYGKDFPAVVEAIKTAQSAEKAQREQAIIDEKRATLEDLELRRLVATGHTAEADAMRFTIQQQREYAQAIKDGADAATLATLAQVQLAEAEERAAQIAQTNQRAQEDYAVRALRASGETHAANVAEFEYQQAREMADALKAGLDPATLAALKFAQSAEAAAFAVNEAARMMQQAVSDIERDAKVLGLSPEEAFRRESDAFGFGGLTREQVKALYTPYTGTELTPEQERINNNIAKWMEDFDRVFGVAAAAAAGGRRGGGITEAIATSAKSLTEVTGNRMADYLASILVVEREQLRLWQAHAAPRPFGSFSPTPQLDLTALDRMAAGSAPSAARSGPAQIVIQFAPKIVIQTEGKGDARAIAKEVDRVLDDKLPAFADKINHLLADQSRNESIMQGDSDTGF